MFIIACLDAAVEAGVGREWNKYLCLPVRMSHFLWEGNCTQVVCMVVSLHDSETWPVKKEKELTLQRAEMRMTRWMWGVKITDTFTCSELRERLGTEDIITAIQRQVKMVRTCFKDENDWVKKCMNFEVEGVRPRDRPKKPWSEVVEKDCQTW